MDKSVDSSDQSLIPELPVSVNISMFCISIVIGAIPGIMIATAFFGTVLSYVICIPIFVIICTRFGYVVFLRPAIRDIIIKKNNKDKTNTLENRVDPETARNSIRLEETQPIRKITLGKVVSTIWGASVVFSLFYFCAASIIASRNTKVFTPFSIGCLIYFIVNIFIAMILSIIQSRHGSKNKRSKTKFISTNSIEGVVHGSEMLTMVNGVWHYKVFVAARNIEKLLAARVASNNGLCPYEKGDKVFVKHDARQPKKCIIIED